MAQTNARPVPATRATPSRVSVGTGSTAIVAANPDRRVAIVHVVAGGPVYLGSGAPATTDGFPVATGGVFEHHNTAPLTGVVAAGTADVRVWEEEG